MLIRLTSNRLSQNAASLLPPIFFLSLTPLFHLAILALKVDRGQMGEEGWMFPDSTDPTDPTSSPAAVFFPSWGGDNISWKAVLATFPTQVRVLSGSSAEKVVLTQYPSTQVSCVVFSLMHAPINIPSMSISTGIDVDMNKELVTHGKSNLVSAGPPQQERGSESTERAKQDGRARTRKMTERARKAERARER
jgi:SulP family sulfate permease